VPVGNVNGLVNVILQVLKNENLRKRIAEGGRRRAKGLRAEKTQNMKECIVKY